MKPFGVISDNHAHNWDAFSKTLPTGVNSRLQDILNEITNAGANVLAAGGDTLYFGGDLFHIRGSVSPTVTNPLIDALVDLAMKGVKCRILTGNHDLQSRDSEALSSACETLRCVPDVSIISQPTSFADDKVAMIPWFDKVEAMRDEIAKMADALKANGDDLADWTLIIHAPVNGVILGIPDHGFTPAELAAFGFKYVLAGHYHSHKRFEEGKVISIGSSTHQTWNDVGTLAGHMIIDASGPTFHDNKAPKFIDYDLAWDVTEASEKVAGNFVRVVMGEATNDEIEFIREHVQSLDAAGVVINAIPVPKGTVTARATTIAAPTTRQSVSDWIDNKLAGADAAKIADVKTLAHKILDDVESIEA